MPWGARAAISSLQSFHSPGAATMLSRFRETRNLRLKTEFKGSREGRFYHRFWSGGQEGRTVADIRANEKEVMRDAERRWHRSDGNGTDDWSGCGVLRRISDAGFCEPTFGARIWSGPGARFRPRLVGSRLGLWPWSNISLCRSILWNVFWVPVSRPSIRNTLSLCPRDNL
jgi:hypothetical protein